MYETSIHIVMRYVARKYDNGDDIIIILNKLKIPTLEKLEALDSMADNVDKDIYIEYVKAYKKENRTPTSSAKDLYLLVLGQRTESLRTKLTGKEN